MLKQSSNESAGLHAELREKVALSFFMDPVLVYRKSCLEVLEEERGGRSYAEGEDRLAKVVPNKRLAAAAKDDGGVEDDLDAIIDNDLKVAFVPDQAADLRRQGGQRAAAEAAAADSSFMPRSARARRRTGRGRCSSLRGSCCSSSSST
jgi:hypothetical protein